MIVLHRAARADRLVDALGDVLADALADPMAAEVVAVPTRGIERYLAQELSARLGVSAGRRDGVCANVAFPFPGRVVGGAVAQSLGIDADRDPWRPERLAWPLLALLDAHLDEPWLSPLRAHLAGSAGGDGVDATRRTRRFAAARHIADLFDRYAVHRPAMLLHWAANTAEDRTDLDGSGQPLEPDASWQAMLWRRAAERVKVTSPAERLAEAVKAIREGSAVLDLPARVSLFGLTALPASYLEILSALAAQREVHLFLLHPSPGLWDRVAGTLPGASSKLPRRDDDPSRLLAQHPLVRSWARDAREMQVAVAAAGIQGGGSPADTDSRPAEPDTLLGRIQSDVRADQAPAGPPLGPSGMRGPEHDARPLLSRRDRSLQVHACHGRTRQVEVLRDALLHLLAADPQLEARDIIVMCPDIEVFAPIITAVFGAHAVHPGASEGAAGRDDGFTAEPALPDLRVRLADRAIRQTNPLLRTVAELLALADSRVTASEVLGLLSREPVRRRFRLADGDLERLDAWVAEARVRWGFDGDHRAAFGLDGVAANTWRAGLDRVLLGVAMADEDERLLGDTVPLDDVEGSEVVLAGRLAELLDRLDDALADLRGPHTVAGWKVAIERAAELLTAGSEGDAWQGVQLHRLLGDLVEEAADDIDAAAIPLTLPEVRSLLDERLRGRPTRANHRTGDLTVCTLVPMRSVPHRVVALLGLDDGVFPRRINGDGDDLIDRDPRVGDRDPRTEDRQLLLDALLAAGTHLVVTYTGRDERTNEPRPPAVPIGELLDLVDRTVRTADGRRAREHVVVTHPLQSFDARSFQAGALVIGSDVPWGFDPVALDGAVARAGEQTPRPLVTGRLELEEASEDLSLQELVRFLQHPARGFLQRLGVHLPSRADAPSDAIPTQLTGLDEWAVGERLLRARLDGGDGAAVGATERARGVLPPGGLGDAVLSTVQANVDALVAAVADEVGGAGTRRSIEVAVPLGDGRMLTGAVPEVIDNVVLTVEYGKLKPKRRLAAWIRFLAAVATVPERPLRAVTVGRRDGPRSAKNVTVSCLEAPAADAAARSAWALGHLNCLVELYDRGRREPLPVYCATSAAWAEQTHAGKDPDAVETAARRVWTTDWRYAKEDRDPEHVLLLGPDTPFEALLSAPPLAEESGEGWSEDERSRFGRCARRLWDGLLAAESCVHA